MFDLRICRLVSSFIKKKKNVAMKETGIRRSLPEATELVHAFRYIACGQTQITCDSNFWLAYTKEYIDDKEQSGIL